MYRVWLSTALICSLASLASCSQEEEGDEKESKVFRITTGALPEVYLNVACTLPLHAADGAGAPYSWGLIAGGLPPGLTLGGSATDDNAIVGTPTAVGVYPFTIRVQDASGAAATKAFSLSVSNRLHITTTSIPSLIVNVPGSRTVTAVNGSGAGYTWAVTTGVLPPGLVLAPGGTPSTTLSGSPTTLGTFNFTIEVTDSFANTDTRAYAMRIVPPLIINSASLVPAIVSEVYSANVTAAGGTGLGYVWQLTSAIPPGMAVDSGTPSATLRGIPGAAASYTLDFLVTDSDGHTDTATLILDVDPELRITTGWVPDGTQAAGYSFALQATGGRGTYAWSVVDGAPPTGITLSGAGTLGGMPTGSGVAVFRARLQDGAARVRTRVYELSIVSSGSPLALRTQLPPVGVTGRAYEFRLNGTGGTGVGYGWSVTGGLLPTGLSLDATGTPAARLFGTPSVPGDFSFTVQIMDSGSATATANYDLTIADPGTILAYAGGGAGSTGGIGDGGAASLAMLNEPHGVDQDAAGNLYIADTQHNRIRRVDATSGGITTVAGNGLDGFSGDSGQATAAEIWLPHDIVVDRANDLLYIADYGNGRIRRVDFATGIITTFAGGGTVLAEGAQAVTAQLDSPEGLGIDSAGNVYVACRWNQFGNRVRRIDRTTGVITTVAGIGTEGFSGDNGQATSAQLGQPRDVAVDAAGNVFIADSLNNRVRRVDASSGVITTFAGTGTQGASGDGGQAVAATLSNVGAVAFDAAGNLFIADTYNNRVRRVAAGTNIISTIAGSGTPGATGGGAQGDGSAATAATLDRPSGVCVDASGDVLIGDTNNHRVRIVDSASQDIDTFAGGGFSVSGAIPPTAAQFNTPRHAAIDGAGNVFIPDLYGHFVYRVSAATGLMEVFAGTGTAGGGGDGGAATAAELDGPTSVAADRAGNIYICEAFGHRVRRVDALTGVIARVAGTGTGGYSGDGGAGANAQLETPISIAFHPSSALLIMDMDNLRLRRLDLTSGIITRVAGNGVNSAPVQGSAADSQPLPICFGVSVALDGDIAICSASQDVWMIAYLTGVIDSITSGSPLQSLSGVAIAPSKDVLLGDETGHFVWRVPAGTSSPAAIAGTGVAGDAGDGGPATSATISAPCIPAVNKEGDCWIVSGSRVRIVLAP